MKMAQQRLSRGDIGESLFDVYRNREQGMIKYTKSWRLRNMLILGRKVHLWFNVLIEWNKCILLCNSIVMHICLYLCIIRYTPNTPTYQQPTLHCHPSILHFWFFQQVWLPIPTLAILSCMPSLSHSSHSFGNIVQPPILQYHTIYTPFIILTQTTINNIITVPTTFFLSSLLLSLTTKDPSQW